VELGGEGNQERGGFFLKKVSVLSKTTIKGVSTTKDLGGASAGEREGEGNTDESVALARTVMKGRVE